MSKKIQVLGIEIDNYTIREMMLLLEDYISSEGLHIVQIITPELLLLASEHDQIKEMIDKVDLQVIGDVSILEVVSPSHEQQQSEVQKKELEELFLRSLIRKKKTVYWIGHTEEQLAMFKDYMNENYPDLVLVGQFAGKIEEDDTDYILNDINSVAPDVLLLNLSSPLQENFVFRNRNRFNAKLCICIGLHMKSKFLSRKKSSKIKSLIDQTIFKRKALKYMSDHEMDEC